MHSGINEMFRLIAFFGFSLNFVVSYDIIPLSSDIWDHPYSPHFDAPSQSLYFVDFMSENRTINRYDLAENRIYSASIPGSKPPAFFVPLKNRPNQFAGGIERTVKSITWNGKDAVATITQDLFSVEQSPKYAANYWNMAKASPTHHFYGGTYRTEICSLSTAANASLYAFTRKQGVKRLWKNMKLSSGLDWNTTEKKFYVVDSCNGYIREFDYNPKTLALCNERIVFRFCDIHGDKVPQFVPLGMTIDRKGFLWVALYYGGAVLKIDPRKAKVVEKIKLPAEIVTAVAFGGPNLDILFVMTGSKAFSLSNGEVSTTPFSSASGIIFMIKELGAKGFPARKLHL